MRAAKELRAFLKELGLVAFLKTTGGKGLHIVVPIARRTSWPEVKSFAKRVGELMTERSPERYLTRISIAERRGKIFIDYLRNDPDLHRCRPVFHPRPRRRAGRHAAGVGRTHTEARSQSLRHQHRAQAPRQTEIRSMGGHRQAGAKAAEPLNVPRSWPGLSRTHTRLHRMWFMDGRLRAAITELYYRAQCAQGGGA